MISTAIDDTDIRDQHFRPFDQRSVNQTSGPRGSIFNPVRRMKLMEVAIGEQTSDETKERALFARQIGSCRIARVALVLVNRVLFPTCLTRLSFSSRASTEKD
jgi:hypothetical protein